ncbi:MAG: polysaccharide biosynthesis/export family protein [Candidatus Omnitrophica bacterium]|nr:polysaccharide biosynthesis/export family protein [Candidatus Omnitrophota bacterium]
MTNRKKFYSYVILVMMFAVFVSGCGRWNAPKKNLDFSVYSPPGTIASEGKYYIGSRDELEVFVWRCPELDSTVIVRPEDGNITLPLVGDIKAAGLTPKELAESISSKMAAYVKEPRIAVGVKKFGDKKVFILGQVLAQGTYRLEKEDRIIDLISRAGGFTDSAMSSATYVIRGGYNDPKIIRTNVARLIKKGDISQNIYLMEGDIIYVPETEIEDLNYVFRKLFPSLFFAEKLANLQQSIINGSWDWAQVWRKNT